MIYVLSGIIIGCIILILCMASKKGQDKFKDMPSKVYSIVFPVLLITFAFLITHRVTEIPVPLNVDEAGTAYDAWCIANYHCDRFLYHFPVYFINYGGHGSSGLYTYLAAIMIKLFGNSVFSVRLPAILLSVISALALSLTIRKELGNTASVITMFFFCILPFSFMHSRWGLDAYLLFPMMIFSVTVFYFAVRHEKTRWFILSGVVFGLTLYSYSVSFMLVPALLCISLIYLLIIKKITWKNIIALGIPLFLLAIPLMLMLAINNGLIGEIRTRFFTIPQLISYGVTEVGFTNMINCLNFGPNNVFYNLFVNDNLLYNVVPRFGTIYYVSIPLFLYGMILSVKRLIKSVREKNISFDLIMLSLFFAVLLVSMSIDKTNVNRSSGIYISIIYFLTLGCLEILKKSKLAAAVTAVIYLVSFGLFLHYYFTDFSKDLEPDILFASLSDLDNALDFVETVYQGEETVYVLGRSRPYIYTLLSRQVDPYSFNQKMVLSNDDYVKIYDKYRFRLDAVLPDCIYVLTDLNDIPADIEKHDFSSQQFGSVLVYYPKTADSQSEIH